MSYNRYGGGLYNSGGGSGRFTTYNSSAYYTTRNEDDAENKTPIMVTRLRLHNYVRMEVAEVNRRIFNRSKQLGELDIRRITQLVIKAANQGANDLVIKEMIKQLIVTRRATRVLKNAKTVP